MHCADPLDVCAAIVSSETVVRPTSEVTSQVSAKVAGVRKYMLAFAIPGFLKCRVGS